MTQKHPNPLRLEPPVRIADEALGERLALLARASTPSAVRRRAAWRAPLAGLAIVAGTGGLAYGAQSVVHHITTPPNLVPGHSISPSATPSQEQAEVRLPVEASASEAAEENASGHGRAHRSGKSVQGHGHGKGVDGSHGNNGQGGDRDRGVVSPGKAVGKGTSGDSGTAPGTGSMSGSGTGSTSGSGTGSATGSGKGHHKMDERGEVSGER